MSLVTLPRWPSPRQARAGARLAVEPLEDRSVPAASLISFNFGQTTAANDAQVVGISDDGRYVIFQTTSTNVVDGQIDDIGTMDLFWTDRVTGERLLVSAEANSGGLKAAGVVPSAVNQQANAVISGDGLRVAFVSKRNASFLDSSFGLFAADAGDQTEDVFAWNSEAARQQASGSFFSPDTTALVSRTPFGDAVGLTSRASNPAITTDGATVAFVTKLNASSTALGIFNDNGDFTPDVFRADVTYTTFSTFAFAPELVTAFTDPVVGGTSAFGFYTGVVQVDPLGRYLSGDGFGYAVVSALSPSRLDINNPVSPAGTVDAYFIQFDQFFGTPTVVLASNQVGVTGTSVGGQVTSAIIPRDAPNTIVFAATAPNGNSSIVAGYVNQNGGNPDLYIRTVLGVTPQTAQLVTAQAGTGSFGANGLLDPTVGSYSVSADGSKVFFTSAATNLAAGLTDTNLANDVFVRNVAAGVTTGVSVVAGGQTTGNGASGRPRPTGDGFLVAFESLSTNLVGVADQNGTTDVFVRDLARGTTGIASATPNNSSTGNGASFGVFIGGDRTNARVVFTSQATNLDPSFFTPGGTTNVFEVNAPLPPVDATRVVASSGGLNGLVGLSVFDQAGNLVTVQSIAPFPGFTGPIRTAVADLNNDGIPDLIAGAGPGGGPRVKVLSGVDGSVLADIFAFEPTFTGGVYVAGGDFDGDGFAEVVIGAGENGGPRVLVFDGQTLQQEVDFFAFEDSFRGGVRVAVGDVNGDGILDLVAAAGEGGGPRIKVFNGANVAAQQVILDFFAFELTLRNGVFVSAGDITGDGRADIVAGAGPGGAPRVSAFDSAVLLSGVNVSPDSARFIDFFPFDQSARDGVRVAVKNADGTGFADILVGAGSGPPIIRAYTTSRFDAFGVPALLTQAFANDETVGQFGAYVG